MTTTTAYLSDGRHVDVPREDTRDWQYQVGDLYTTLGLADWYLDQGDKHHAEILEAHTDEPRCGHDERTHCVINESNTAAGKEMEEQALVATRTCHRRACILDAMAWVERTTGERAAWFEFGANRPWMIGVPADIPEPLDKTQPAARPTEQPSP